MVKSVVATLTRFKLNDDGTMREVNEDVDVTSVVGNPQYLVINPKSGDPLVLKGSDLQTAIQHTTEAK